SGSTLTVADGATCENSNTLTVDSGAVVTIGSGSTLTNTKTVDNGGATYMYGTLAVSGSYGDFENTGTLNNYAAVTIGSGSVMNNYGTATIEIGGTLTVNGTFEN